MKPFGTVLALVLIILGVIHGMVYLIVKGTIWVAYGLFNINWYPKFWYVYVLIFILSTLFGSNKYKYKRRSK